MNRILKTIAIVLLALFSVSCLECEYFGYDPVYSLIKTPPYRADMPETRRVLLYYAMGYNSINSYIEEDFEDLCSGYLPEMGRDRDVLLVLAHFPVKGGGYMEMTPSYLIRLYKNFDGEPVRDTVKVFTDGEICATAAFTGEVLEYVKDNYPAKEYGMVFSSHGTGWLPPEYTLTRSAAKQRSVGNEQYGVSGSYDYYEIDLKDFAAAFPMKFSYILFDACLMGGIEVAYELKEVCDHIGFSQTEILAEGFDYTTLASLLIPNGAPSDPEAVCRRYFESYAQKSSSESCATVSYIDCRSLEPLSVACKAVFDRCRPALKTMDQNKLQRFFRTGSYYWPWFFDLRDIISECGASDEEMAAVDAALKNCVIYADHTASFLGIKINRDCGLSMYAPVMGNSYLDNYYRDLKWNKATGLVQ